MQTQFGLGILAALLVFTQDAKAAWVFVVNTTSDNYDGYCDLLDCSLREAIDAAYLASRLDESGAQIWFNIPGPGPHTIQVTEALPHVTEHVTIDGTTQPGYAGTPIIELDGAIATEANVFTDELWLAGDYNVAPSSAGLFRTTIGRVLEARCFP